jgi:hypothetical protein
MIADLLSRLARRVAVEWVPKEDEKVRLLLRDRDDVFPGYGREGFERAFGARFELESRDPIGGTGRILYVFRRR